ncbi:MAG: hypothetical protein M3295_03350 [Chloroflexota bacterium]|nr:hypothetical protein [Chloroflexota bacterium]
MELNPRRPRVTDAYADEDDVESALGRLIPLLERIAGSLERIEQHLEREHESIGRDTD